LLCIIKIILFYVSVQGWRKVIAKGDPKKGITGLVTIAASGNILPTLYIKKGKTTRCLESLSCDGVDEIGTFSNRGWSCEEAMLFYLHNIIVPYTNNEASVLIWDVHASHQCERVQLHTQ
jgi:hypothetical protein